MTFAGLAKGDLMSTSDFQQQGDAAIAAVGVRTYQKLASQAGLLESYRAVFHYSGGCLDPRGMVRICANRYRVRATIKAEVFDAWQDAPNEVRRRYLIATEWQRLVESVNALGFLAASETPHPVIVRFRRSVVDY